MDSRDTGPSRQQAGDLAGDPRGDRTHDENSDTRHPLLKPECGSGRNSNVDEGWVRKLLSGI
jgi:hypothetical protein